ncbi:MAG: hypothetical protein ACO1RA_00235 [Planctomycetaceae bacterium]
MLENGILQLELNVLGMRPWTMQVGYEVLPPNHPLGQKTIEYLIKMESIKDCDNYMDSPTRADVADKLKQLLAGTLTRQAASDWASICLLNSVPVSDNDVWNALELLGGADLISTDRPFLYMDVDFLEALKTIEGRPVPK